MRIKFVLNTEGLFHAHKSTKGNIFFDFYIENIKNKGTVEILIHYFTCKPNVSFQKKYFLVFSPITNMLLCALKRSSHNDCVCHVYFFLYKLFRHFALIAVELSNLCVEPPLLP